MIFIPNVYNTREEVEERVQEHAEKPHRYITGEKTHEMPSNQALSALSTNGRTVSVGLHRSFNGVKPPQLQPACEVRCVCRNIRVLYNFDPPATDAEVRAAALQYVRKISGFAKPSAANEAAFKRAVEEIVNASSALLESLVTAAAPRNREAERAKAQARAAARFGSKRAPHQ